MCTGCLAEIASGLREYVLPYAEELFKLFFKGVADEEDEVRNNSAFGLGVLCESLGPHGIKYYPQVLQKLHPLFYPGNLFNGEISSTVDNACGAVARMIITSPTSLPLDQVLPVFLNALPLKIDFEENKHIFDCIFLLYSLENQYLLQHLPQLLSICASTLIGDDQVKPETRAGIIGMMRSLLEKHGSLTTQALQSLSPQHQALLLPLLN